MAIFLIDFENVHDSGISGITSLSSDDEVCIFYSQKSEHMSFDTHVNIMKAEAKVQYIKLRKSAKNYLDFQLVTHLGYLIGAKVDGPYFIISKDTGYDSVVDYWKDHGVTVTRQPSIGFNLKQNRQNFQPAPQTSQITKSTAPAAAAAKAPETESKSEDLNILAAPEEADAEVLEAETTVADSIQEEAVQTDASVEPVETSEAETPETEEITVSEEPEQVLIKPDTLPESYRKKVRTALKGKNIPSGNYSAIYKAIVNSYDKLALNNLMVKSFGSSKGGLVYNAIRDIFTEYHS